MPSSDSRWALVPGHGLVTGATGVECLVDIADVVGSRGDLGEAADSLTVPVTSTQLPTDRVGVEGAAGLEDEDAVGGEVASMSAASWLSSTMSTR